MCGSDAAEGEVPVLPALGRLGGSWGLLPAQLRDRDMPCFRAHSEQIPSQQWGYRQGRCSSPTSPAEAVEEDGIVSLYLLSALVIRSACVDAAKE